MPADFNTADKYSATKAFTQVVFGNDAIILETELNEMQKILKERISAFTQSCVADGFFNKPTMTLSGGNLTLPVDTFSMGGYLVSMQEPMTLSVANGDTIYLAYWEVGVNHTTAIKRGGNLSGGTAIADNGIFDSRPFVNEETTRRVQAQMQLVKSNAESGKLYLPIATLTTATTFTDNRPNTQLNFKQFTQNIANDYTMTLRNSSINGRGLLVQAAQTGNNQAVFRAEDLSGVGLLIVNANKAVSTANNTLDNGAGSATLKALAVSGGSSSFRINGGASDHTYVSIYARAATPDVRSGYWGYGSAGTPHMTMSNDEVGGDIVLSPAGGRNVVLGNYITAAATGAPVASLTFSNPTANVINFGASGMSVPSANNSAVGTKIILNTLGAYAIGVDSSEYTWMSSKSHFSWYSQKGTSSNVPVSIMNLSSGGLLTPSQMALPPTSTATASNTYPSGSIFLDRSTWNGTAAVTGRNAIQLASSGRFNFINELSQSVFTISQAGDVEAAGGISESGSPLTNKYLRLDASNKMGAGKSIFFTSIATPNAIGSYFYNTAGDTVLGGEGLYSDASSPVRMYLAHGASPWSSNLGLYVNTTGNVGIKKIAPAYPLDVVGDINSTTALREAGTLISAKYAPLTAPKFVSNYSLGDRYAFNFVGLAAFNAVANSKIDIYFPATTTTKFIGYFDVIMTGSYNTANAGGKLVKRFHGYLGGAGANQYRSNYVTVEGGYIEKHISIGDPVFDAANDRWIITIAQRTVQTNSFAVFIEAASASPISTLGAVTATLGTVYTTDTTVFPLPTLELVADKITVGRVDYGRGFLEHTTSASVNTATPQALTDINGNPLDVTQSYRVTGYVGSTNTQTGAVSIFKGTGTNFIHDKIYEAGTTTNHVEFFLDTDGVPKVRVFNHTSLYTINLFIETLANRGRGFSDLAMIAKADKTVASASADGLMSIANFNKLLGIATGANNYTHPATHPASIIVQDASNRFMTDAERTKLTGVEAGAQVNSITLVAGKTGIVVLTKDDVGLSNVANESKATMFASAALTGTPTAPTATKGTATTQIANMAALSAAIGDYVPKSQTALASGVDLNTITSSGFYRLSSSHVNIPSPAPSTHYAQLIVSRGGDTIAQMLIGYVTNSPMWIRSGSPSDVGGTGTWGAWKKVLYSGDVTASDVGLDLVQNFPLATQALAEAGTSNSHFMTPLRVFQAIAARMQSTDALTLTNATLKNYNEQSTTTNFTGVTQSTTLSLADGNVFELGLNMNAGAILTVSFSNVAAAGKAHSITLILNVGSNPASITWPSGVKWNDDEAPDLSNTSKTTIITLVTTTGGTRWYGMLAGNNFTT